MLARTARMPATFGELPDAAAQIVACFDGPFTAAFGGAARRPGRRRGTSSPTRSSTGPRRPRLGLLMLRDAVPETPTPEVAEGEALTEAIVESARETGVKVSQVTAEEGHPLVRLAGQIATTDFAATYLALGLGLDPAISPHVADLRERSGRE